MMRPVWILLVAFVCVGRVPVASARGVELLSSSEDGVVVRYEPGEADVRSISASGVDYVSVLLPDSESLGIPGAPDLPVVRITVGVPDCEGIDMAVSTGPETPYDGVRVIPSPSVMPVDEGAISDYRFVEGEQYRQQGPWPYGAAAMQGPGVLATQRVVEIELRPCRFDPASSRLTVYDSIEVTLSFRGVRAAGGVRADSPRRERMLDAALLNYASAKAWRVSPAGRAPRTGDSFGTSSNWARLRVAESAVCRIGYSDLRDAGIVPGSVDPRTIRIFTGPGISLPENFTAPRPDWMEECDILVQGEADGAFNEDDAIVFCAVGVDGWADELGITGAGEPFHENRYANENAYWLTWESPGAPSGFSDDPHRMSEDDLQSSPSAAPADAYWARIHLERNIYEWPGKSDNWFWQEMQQSPLPERRYFHQLLDHVRPDSTALLRVRVDGSSSVAVYPDHHAVFSLNGQEVYVGDWDGEARLMFEVADAPVVDGYNTLEIYLPREAPDHEKDNILVDWYDLEYWRELWAAGERLAFGSSGRTGEIRYSAGGFTSTDVAVFKVIDRYTARTVPGVAIEGSSSGFRVVFQDEVADTASYLAVSAPGYVTPDIERDSDSGLRTVTSADYIMVVHDGFYDEALRLKSYRESDEGGNFAVRVVRVSDVYDEFSWGVEDPTAIRDFLKYTWENASPPPTHTILIGDTSSDYRGYFSSSVPCYVPTHYEPTIYSALAPVDAWFVGFDAVSGYHLATALGRLPARSVSELSTMIDKIIRYEAQPVLGPWRNTAILIGDDEYKTGQPPPTCCEFFHTEQAEQLSTETLPWPLDRKKVYLMEYSGDAVGRKPGARSDIIEAWNQGALFLNYTGHGSEIVLAHESVFLYDDVSLLHNIDGLPLFFAASCRLNRFDQQTVDSMGELLVKSATGGAICSIGSTRDSASGMNSALNRRFHAAVFGNQRDAPTPVLDVGSALQAAFTTQPLDTWRNNTLFVLIGDPALMLAAPRGAGLIDGAGVEPMRRRDTVSVAGANEGGTEGLDGIALVTVTDSADTSGFTHVPPPILYRVNYALPGRVVYRGPVPTTDGQFSAQFVVSSVSAEGPHARIGAYFYGSDVDGSCSLENVSLADSVEVSDTQGPDITLEFEGGGTSVLPETGLSITLFDENGINLIGRGSSGAITMSFDGGDTMDITGDFGYDVGGYREGTIERRLPTLAVGGHTIEVSASDNIGNRSAASQWFEVVSATEFEIRNVANSPNPFPEGDTEGTYILFQLPVGADVGVDVFTVGGRLVRQIDEFRAPAGANQVYWDGRDQEGDDLANGVYLYRIHATSEAYRGDRAEVIGRAVIMR
jgi:hypothetical protein